VLNFAPCVLDVPEGVMVRKVDLSTELQILAFHEQRRAAGELDAVGLGAAAGLDVAGLEPRRLGAGPEAGPADPAELAR
jgi:hypothetical protein